MSNSRDSIGDLFTTVFALIGFYSTMIIFPGWVHDHFVSSPSKSIEEYREENDELRTGLDNLSSDYSHLKIAYNESCSKMVGISIGADKHAYNLVSTDASTAYQQGYNYIKTSDFDFDPLFTVLESPCFFDGFTSSYVSAAFDIKNDGDIDSFVEGCRDGLLDIYHLSDSY